jgi:isocitrate lyase
MKILLKINAIPLCLLELGVDDGVIVARTDSEGASLIKVTSYKARRLLLNI